MTPKEHEAEFGTPEIAIVHISHVKEWNRLMGRGKVACVACPYFKAACGDRDPCTVCPSKHVYIPANEVAAFTIWKASQHETD